MTATDTDTKQQAILTSAWRAFSTYGFRKTSMDDIARGAGMSRPALYLHYRNKEDIYRHLVKRHYDEAVQAVRTALAGPGPVPDLLDAAFVASGGDVVEVMLSTPHGMELLDAGMSTSAEIVQDGEARLVEVYAEWLEQAAQAGQIRLTGPAGQIAATIAAALKGIKMAKPDYATYRAQIGHLAALTGAGLVRPRRS